MFDSEFARWERPGAWQRFHLRGTALRRESYLEVGGLEYRYRRFAEWLLSARLHVRGQRLLPFRSVRVHHVNCETFGQFHDSIGEFGRGESLFRLEETDRAFVRRFFGTPPNGRLRCLVGRPDRTDGSRGDTSHTLDLAPHRHTGYGTLREDLAVISDLFRRWLWGRWLLPLVLRLSLWWWKAVLSWASRGRHRAFLRYYDTEAAIARVEFALQRRSHGSSRPERPLLSRGPGRASHLRLPRT